MPTDRSKLNKRNSRDALKKRLQQQKRAALIRLFGTIDYDDMFDYRRERLRKRDAV